MSQLRPKVVELKLGVHFICACGKTKNAPFCDGNHTGTGIQPIQEKVESEPKRIAWCACEKSANIPYCDGSHAQAL